MQKYWNTVTKRTGAVVSGASVTVTTYPAGGAATIYSDDGVTPAANPLTTDANGFFSFYAADGRYSIAVTGNDITPYSIDDVALIEDPADDKADIAALQADVATRALSADLASTSSGKGVALLGYSTTGETAKAALDARLPEISTYALLRAYSGALTAFYVRGVTSILDGGAGIFRVDAADTTSADNGGTILVDALGRRWKREYSGAANILWFGADRSGVDDSTAAVQAACVACNHLYAPEGTYKLTAAVSLRRDFTLDGAGPGRTVFQQSGAASGFVMNETTAAALVRGLTLKEFSVVKTGAAATSGQDGINLTGTTNNVWGCKVRHVNVSGFYDGVVINRPILTELDNCDSASNVRHGFVATGGGTSLIFKNTYARSNGGRGYEVTGNIQYLGFDTTAADSNGAGGYYLGGDASNYPVAVALTACGAESNTGDGFTFANVENVDARGCFALSNTENGFHAYGARGVVLGGCKGQTNGAWGVHASNSHTGKIPSTVVTIGCSWAGNASGRIGNLSVISDLASPDTNLFDFQRDVDAGSGFLVNGTRIFDSSCVASNLGFGSQIFHWYKVQITYANLAAAALTGDYQFPNLIPDGSIVEDVYVQLTQEFSGGAVASATLEIGDAGAPYSNWIPAQNVFTGAGTGYKATNVSDRGTRLYTSATNLPLRMPVFGANRPVFARLRTTGANTNALTQGAVTVWIGFAKLP